MAESLTARKRETDAGYKPLPIGGGGPENHRWPTQLRGEDGGVRTFGLGSVESHKKPLWLSSAREYAHVFPELLKNMPVPGMLDAFEKILKHPIVYLESDPGFGKSYLANLIGNAMHPEGAVIYDASSNGGNLESLLYQTVFDSNASSDLVDRINSALRDGTMTPLSLKALRELKINKGTEEKPDFYHFLSEEGEKKVFDWKGLEQSGLPRKTDDKKGIDDILESVKSYQEWNGGLRIGFKDVDGALIRAALEHRPLVIDEFARRKLMSEDALQRVWQCIAGAKGFEEITIPLGNLGEFTLRHGDIPKVIMTSNKQKDGPGVKSISPSLQSRLVKAEINAFTAEDWAHRISQDLTGVPVTTLARLEKGRMLEGPNPEDAKWEVANHEEFRHNLGVIRHANEVAVPRLQTKLLDHWQDVIAVSQALGRAYHESAALLDPDSDLLQQPDMAAIRHQEVDKAGDKVEGLTPRKMLEHLLEAMHEMAEKIPATETKGGRYSGNWNMPNITPSKESTETRMGDRLKTVVEHWIDDVAGVTPDGAKRPKLYAQLRKVWEEAGVIGPDSVLDRLNIKSITVEATTDEVRQAQAVINNYLKARHPGFGGVKEQEVELFLKGLQNVPPKSLGDETVEAHVLTSTADSIADGAFTDTIAVVSGTKDRDLPDTEESRAIFDKEWKDFLSDHPPGKLVDQDKAISTLALPYVGKELLQAISKTPDGASYKPAATYSGNAPFVITTTIAKSSEKGTDAYAKLHVVHNKQTGKSLVVAFTRPTVEMERDSSVTVVNAKDRDAARQVKSWLGANAAGTLDELREAFEERNLVPDGKANARLEALLTDATIKTLWPTMLDGSHSTSRSV